MGCGGYLDGPGGSYRNHRYVFCAMWSPVPSDDLQGKFSDDFQGKFSDDFQGKFSCDLRGNSKVL